MSDSGQIRQSSGVSRTDALPSDADALAEQRIGEEGQQQTTFMPCPAPKQKSRSARSLAIPFSRPNICRAPGAFDDLRVQCTQRLRL